RFNFVKYWCSDRTHVLKITTRYLHLCFYGYKSLLNIKKTQVHFPGMLEFFRKTTSYLCWFFVLEIYFFESLCKQCLDQFFFLYLYHQTQMIKLNFFVLNKLT